MMNVYAAGCLVPIVTIQGRKHAAIPTGLLADTPEEYRRRGDAADALWRELVRRVDEKT
jgi:hypothetical protein